MERLKNKSSNSQDRLYGILAFILGLVVCNDVVYVFKISNSYINIAVFIPVCRFLFLLFRTRISWLLQVYSDVFYLYICIRAVSTFMAIITFLIMPVC